MDGVSQKRTKANINSIWVPNEKTAGFEIRKKIKQVFILLRLAKGSSHIRMKATTAVVVAGIKRLLNNLI
jgi:hypothetical protein